MTSPWQGRTSISKQFTNDVVGFDHERLNHLGRFVWPLHFDGKFVLAMETRTLFSLLNVQSEFIRLPGLCQLEQSIPSTIVQGVLVRKVLLHENDCFMRFGGDNVVVIVEYHLNDHSKSWNICPQRTEVICKPERKHRQDCMRKIDRRCSCLSCSIE